MRQVTLPPAARGLSTLRHVDVVLGWEVRRSTPDVALLGAYGRLGLSGELLFERQQHTLLFATFVQLENRVARALWAGIALRHRLVVRGSPRAGQLAGTVPALAMNPRHCPRSPRPEDLT